MTKFDFSTYHTHKSSYRLSNIYNQKGYKTHFRRSGHICILIKTRHALAKLSFKKTILILFYKSNNIRVCKIKWLINWLIITNTAIKKCGISLVVSDSSCVCDKILLLFIMWLLIMLYPKLVTWIVYEICVQGNRIMSLLWALTVEGISTAKTL